MFCEKCGKEVNAGDKFCESCGSPIGKKKKEKVPFYKNKWLWIYLIISVVGWTLFGDDSETHSKKEDNYNTEETHSSENVQLSEEKESEIEDTQLSTEEVVAISGDLYKDVQDGLLYSNVEGQITDKKGNVLSVYSYLEVLENGAIWDGECILEGLFAGAGGKIVLDIPGDETTDIKDVDYAYLYGGVLDSVINEFYGYNIYYVLHDLNNDGYLDLILQSGTCNADMGFEVYTTDGTRNTYLGRIEGLITAFYEYEKGNGIYVDYEGGDGRTVRLITIEGNYLMENTIYSGLYEHMPELDMLKNKIEDRLLSEGFTW